MIGSKSLWAFFLAGYCLAVPPALAQVPEELRNSSPLMQVFGADDYQAHGQNWGFHQLEDGRLLVANNRGVLLYDGARFERLAPTDGFNAFGFLESPSGRILVNANGELGELVAAPGGSFDYVALLQSEDLQISGRLGLVAWQDQVWLVSDQALFRLDGDEVIEVQRLDEGRFRHILVMNDQLFVVHDQRGLLRLSVDELEPVLEDPVVSGEGQIVVQRMDPGRYMMLNGAGQGLLLMFDSNKLSSRPLAELDHWQGALSMLADQRVYDIIKLSDGRIAMATIRAGVFVFSARGELELRVDANNGLPVDTVLGLAEDREGGLWMATLAGIVRAAIHQGVHKLDERHNLGAVIQHALHHDGQLWIATSVGVMRFEQRRFETVAGIVAQTWRLGSLGGIDEPEGVLISHDEGLAWWRDGQVEDLLAGPTGYSLTRVRPGHWMMGTQLGVIHVCWDGRAWQTAAVPGIEAMVRSLTVDEEGVVWAGSLAEAAFRIQGLESGCPFEADGVEIRRLGHEQGLPNSNYAEVYRLGGQVRIGTRFGMVRPDDNESRLLPDTDFPEPYHDGSVGWFVTGEDQQGRVFAQLLAGDRRWTELFIADELGQYQPADLAFEELPWSRSEGYVIDGRGTWFLGVRQMTHVDLDRFRSRPAPDSAPMVRVIGESMMTAIELADQTLPRDRSSLSFRFSLPVFDFSENRVWRSRLVGFDSDWSDWTTVDFRDFTNLPGGRYQLEVQARDGLGRRSPVSELSFAVAQPWYLMTPAMLVWLLLVGTILLLAARLGRATLATRNRQLEQLVAERTEELRQQRDRMATMAYQDALTGLPNRRDMYRSLTAELARCRSTGQAMTLMAIDLNDFKQINDRFGHAVGDQTLQRVAQLISEQVRPNDKVFRPGGDELVVLCSGLDADSARQRARDVALAVEQAQWCDIAPGLAVGVSIGVASISAPNSWEEVLEQADQALYRAKRSRI